MTRDYVRVASVLALLLAAVFTPLFVSGYSEWRRAEAAASYPEVAEHYLTAAQRLPWQPGLYELAGTAYYRGQDYPNAQAAYQKASARGGLSAEGWVAWGDVVYLQGDPERAFQLWQEALAQPNPSPHLYSRLGKVFQERRDYPAAAENLKKLVAAQPDDASARYRLGLLLTLLEPENAIPELLHASELDPQFDPVAQTLRTALNLASITEPDSERFVIIGRGLGLAGEWELALAAFEQAAREDGKNAEAWAWLAEADQQTAGSEALTYLDRALELNPQSSTVHSLRGLYFQRTGNHRDALSEFQAAARLDPENPSLFVSLGDAYAMTGDLALGLQSYQYAASLAPEDVNYHILLAAFCAQNNTNLDDVGIPAAQKAVQMEPKNSFALDVLGWSYSLAGRQSEAERMLLLAIEHDPQNASAHFHLGVVYLQKNERAQAYERLTRARELGSAEADMALRQYFPQ